MLVRILRMKLKRNTINISTNFRNNNKIIEIHMKYGEYFSYFPEMLKNLKIIGESTKYYDKLKR